MHLRDQSVRRSKLLETNRDPSTNAREEGGCFERLVRVFLTNDDIEKQFYSAVALFNVMTKSSATSSHVRRRVCCIFASSMWR